MARDRTAFDGVMMLGVGVVALVLTVVSAHAAPPQTMEPGKLHVALNGDMPVADWRAPIVERKEPDGYQN